MFRCESPFFVCASATRSGSKSEREVADDGRLGFIRRSAHPVGSSIMLLAGFGFISRMYGLSIDNLVEVEMVLADGRIVTINAEADPGERSSEVAWGE